MITDELLNSLPNDRENVSSYTLYVLRHRADTDDFEGAIVVDIEFDHADKEVNLLANFLLDGEAYAGQAMSVATLISRLTSESPAAGSYALFATSQWASLPSAWEGRQCLPLAGLMLNRGSAMVGLMVDSRADQRSS